MFKTSLLLTLVILSNALANVAMKLTSQLDGSLLNKLLQWQLWLIFVCFGVSFLAFIELLKYIPLNIATSFIAVQYAVIIFVSWFFFNEKITMGQLAGIALIIIGIAIVGYFNSNS